MAHPLLTALPLRDAGRVLEVACGTGGLLADLRAAASRAGVTGVDRAAGMLRVARAVQPAGLAAIDAQQLAARPGAVDVAVVAFALFHFQDPLAGLAEMHRVLREGGSIGIVTWGKDDAVPGLEIWTEELDRAGAPPDSRDASIMLRELMDTEPKLRGLLDRSRWEDVSVWSRTFEYSWTLPSCSRCNSAAVSPRDGWPASTSRRGLRAWGGFRTAFRYSPAGRWSSGRRFCMWSPGVTKASLGVALPVL
ncbi:MAG: methyltransferase domain-containing protein [Gemmatimonadetes bacterium]|nr:methyltransferase domain-containing protein [Gemmatimonadota bacterium]